ncbi:hypothetical protein pSalSNUABM01_141 [Salmonella phage pSal-SNUABM-01]|nr:hypothetical protein pSalSNUABM01_141 [Salmonella phage pSal-SNUABM-01]
MTVKVIDKTKTKATFSELPVWSYFQVDSNVYIKVYDSKDLSHRGEGFNAVDVNGGFKHFNCTQRIKHLVDVDIVLK